VPKRVANWVKFTVVMAIHTALQKGFRSKVSYIDRLRLGDVKGTDQID
jgi:hypothetical protein